MNLSNSTSGAFWSGCMLVLWMFAFAAGSTARAVEEPAVTREALKQSLDDLKVLAEKARAAGVEPLYADAILMTGPDFVGKQWDTIKDEALRADWAAFLQRRIRAESGQLTSAIAAGVGRVGNPPYVPPILPPTDGTPPVLPRTGGTPVVLPRTDGTPVVLPRTGGTPVLPRDLRAVPPVPDYAKCVWQGNYLALAGSPVLIITAGNSGGGKADPRLAGSGDLYGVVSAVGATRYDYQNTPIWTLYQKDPKSHRIYDGGWCGHIIKDKWSIGGQGGRAGVCIISLDYPPMLEAVRESIVKVCERFKRRGNPDRTKILTMDWEFTYMNYDEPSKQKWQTWLKDRYKTVDKLNAIWKTIFKGFDEATLPPIATEKETNPAKYYDFGEFNLWRFTDYLLWAKNVIKKECPGLPMCVGGGQPFGREFWVQGNDEEYLAVAGVDDVWLSETGSRSWGTASFMDLQHSIAPKMAIMDPEYHGAGGFMSLMFFHGCAALDFYGWKEKQSVSLPHGLAMCTGALDVRRLQEYIVEFPKAVPQAAILYSRASLIQQHPGHTGKNGVQTPYTLELEKCYRAGTVLDTGMGFITTRMISGTGFRGQTANFQTTGNWCQSPKSKVLIVPGAYFANEDEVKQIMEFAKGGGTVVIMPTSFVADEYNRRRAYLKDIGVELVQETVPKYLAKKASAGVAQSGSEYDFIQGPVAKTVVEDEPTAQIVWKSPTRFTGKGIAGQGIRQAIKLTGETEVLAAYEDGSPAIADIKSGQGRVVYCAMQLSEASTGDLLEWVYEQSKLTRPVRVVDAQGNRIPGIESRTVPFKEGHLTYLYNLTESSAKAKLKMGLQQSSIQNLTTGAALKADETIELGPYEWVVLRLK